MNIVNFIKNLSLDVLKKSINFNLPFEGEINYLFYILKDVDERNEINEILLNEIIEKTDLNKRNNNNETALIFLLKNHVNLKQSNFSKILRNSNLNDFDNEGKNALIYIIENKKNITFEDLNFCLQKTNLKSGDFLSLFLVNKVRLNDGQLNYLLLSSDLINKNKKIAKIIFNDDDFCGLKENHLLYLLNKIEVNNIDLNKYIQKKDNISDEFITTYLKKIKFEDYEKDFLNLYKRFKSNVKIKDLLIGKLISETTDNSKLVILLEKVFSTNSIHQLNFREKDINLILGAINNSINLEKSSLLEKFLDLEDLQELKISCKNFELLVKDSILNDDMTKKIFKYLEKNKEIELSINVMNKVNSHMTRINKNNVIKQIKTIRTNEKERKVGVKYE